MCDYIRYVRNFAETLRQEGKFWPKTTFDWGAAFYSLIIDLLDYVFSMIVNLFNFACLLPNLFGFVMVQIPSNFFNILNFHPLSWHFNRGNGYVR